MSLLKSCSFLPAATQMIYDMKLENQLHGVTFECLPESRENNEIIVQSRIEGQDLSSEEIDKIFSESKQTGDSLYWIEETKLIEIAPDIIFTQDVCDICQIDTKCTHEAIDKLSIQPKIIPLSPISLEDVFGCAMTIAKALGNENRAHEYIAKLNKDIDFIVDTIRKHRSPLKRVMVIEWIDPIYNCGHWIPQQIAYAGGVDMLSNPNGDSMVIVWDKIVKYDPEVIVIAPCGFHVDRSMKEMDKITQLPNFNQLTAVKNNSMFLIDYDLFTQPTPSTLTNGIKALASFFHPDLFSLPEILRHKVIQFKNL